MNNDLIITDTINFNILMYTIFISQNVIKHTEKNEFCVILGTMNSSAMELEK